MHGRSLWPVFPSFGWAYLKLLHTPSHRLLQRHSDWLLNLRSWCTTFAKGRVKTRLFLFVPASFTATGDFHYKNLHDVVTFYFGFYISWKLTRYERIKHSFISLLVVLQPLEKEHTWRIFLDIFIGVSRNYVLFTYPFKKYYW